jgi:threonine dehydratase
VAVEALRQIPQGNLDAIFVCCGGGGLLAGIATYVKRLYPDVRVIGVEEVDQDSMHQALLAGKPVTMPEIDLFADGTAVRTVGTETFRLVKEHVVCNRLSARLTGLPLRSLAFSP